MQENTNFNSFKIDDTKYQTLLSNKFMRRKKYVAANPKEVVAYIPGNIRIVYVKEGQKVRVGERLLVLEAMKMKNEILSKIDGVIKKIAITENSSVVKGQLMIELE